MKKYLEDLRELQDKFNGQKNKQLLLRILSHEGGGKLSRGQLADYRLKHIQKLLNKQKKNKTLKKFNKKIK